MRTALLYPIALLLAGCMAQQTPIQDVEAYPVTADVLIASSRMAAASCLHDAARSGPVYQAGPMTVPMPEVSIIARTEAVTDVVVQFFQDWGTGNAALYRLSGSAPTRALLHWPWPNDAEGRPGVKAMRRAPHRWLEECRGPADGGGD